MSEITTIAEYLKHSSGHIFVNRNYRVYWDDDYDEWRVIKQSSADVIFHTPDESKLVKWMVEHE